MSVEQRKSRIPEFSSYEEEAKWWDEHDLADFQDEFQTVKVRFVKSKRFGERLDVRLDDKTFQQLRERAGQMGIDPATLVRMWILEHLPGESPAPPATTPGHR